MTSLFQQSIVKEMRDDIAKKRDEGCVCPVCEQYVRVYKRSVNSMMARQLIHAYKNFGVGAFFHNSEIVMGTSGAGDFAKLAFFGLIEAKKHEKGDQGKRTSGYWCVTPKGFDFINNTVMVQKYAMVYNDEVLGYSGDLVSIVESLNNKFDYNELMKG